MAIHAVLESTFFPIQQQHLVSRALQHSKVEPSLYIGCIFFSFLFNTSTGILSLRNSACLFQGEASYLEVAVASLLLSSSR